MLNALAIAISGELGEQSLTVNASERNLSELVVRAFAHARLGLMNLWQSTRVWLARLHLQDGPVLCDGKNVRKRSQQGKKMGMAEWAGQI